MREAQAIGWVGWSRQKNLREMFMRRTAVGLFVMLALSVLAVSVVAAAQQPTTVYRVGRLSSGSSSLDPNVETFRQGRRHLGYVEVIK